MARFEDYTKDLPGPEPDALEAEIVDAATAAGERQEAATGSSFEMPDRFKGKSPEEIAQSYLELERLNSRQAQNLGAMRKTVDELVVLQLRNTGSDGQDKPSKKPVTVDAFYAEPDETIRKAAREEADARVQSLEQELMAERAQRARTEFSTKFPTWENDVKDPAFLSWIQAKPHRLRLAQSADRGDFGAAEELFGTYYDYRDVATQKQNKQKLKEQAKAVTLETSGADVPDPTETISRQFLLDKRLLAKRGNREAADWLKSNAERVAIAYEEGRIVD